jgi:ELWxxDGT repeat protein
VAAPASLLFFADDGVNGRTLWKTAGTPETTMLVKDILPGSENASGINRRGRPAVLSGVL